MHAVIHMQPLDMRRQPIACYPRKRLAQTVPRDGQPHIVGEAWPLERSREMPYFVRIWADGRSIDREIECAGPAHLRHLDSITFYLPLTVLPRKS